MSHRRSNNLGVARLTIKTPDQHIYSFSGFCTVVLQRNVGVVVVLEEWLVWGLNLRNLHAAAAAAAEFLTVAISRTPQ